MDVYAFASTAYAIFTSKSPFPGKSYGRVMEIVARGHILEKPAEMSGPLWGLLKECWSYRPENRPLMTAIELALAVM